MTSIDPKSRIQALRSLLSRADASTQEELRTQLESLDFEVTQSTVSRDLRRLGAVKMVDTEGRTIYSLPAETPMGFTASLADHIRSLRHSDTMIVITTDPGSASLIGRYIDSLRSPDVLGTIAGDDTVFIAPTNSKSIARLAAMIRTSIENSER